MIRILAVLAVLLASQEAYAACRIGLNNEVICQDIGANSRYTDQRTGADAPANSRVETVSPKGDTKLPSSADAPVNLGNDKADQGQKKADCHASGDGMITLCDGDEDKR